MPLQHVNAYASHAAQAANVQQQHRQQQCAEQTITCCLVRMCTRCVSSSLHDNWYVAATSLH